MQATKPILCHVCMHQFAILDLELNLVSLVKNCGTCYNKTNFMCDVCMHQLVILYLKPNLVSG
jgi:hypothetical protein